MRCPPRECMRPTPLSFAVIAAGCAVTYHAANLAGQGECAELAVVHALLVEVAHVQLNAGMVLGRNELVAPRAARKGEAKGRGEHDAARRLRPELPLHHRLPSNALSLMYRTRCARQRRPGQQATRGIVGAAIKQPTPSIRRRLGVGHAIFQMYRPICASFWIKRKVPGRVSNQIATPPGPEPAATTHHLRGMYRSTVTPSSLIILTECWQRGCGLGRGW